MLYLWWSNGQIIALINFYLSSLWVSSIIKGHVKIPVGILSHYKNSYLQHPYQPPQNRLLKIQTWKTSSTFSMGTPMNLALTSNTPTLSVAAISNWTFLKLKTRQQQFTWHQVNLLATAQGEGRRTGHVTSSQSRARLPSRRASLRCTWSNLSLALSSLLCQQLMAFAS